MFNVIIKKILLFVISFGLLSSCMTEEDILNEEEEPEIVRDIDGNEYEVLTLLGRKWLRQDLRVSRYRDGTPIPRIDDPEDWSRATYGAYSWFENNPLNDEKYGKLYNGYLINCCEICPEGWRMPTESDLRPVLDYFGGLFDFGQYPLVPEWMSIEGVLGGERKPDGKFSFNRTYLQNSTEVEVNFSLKWIKLQDNQGLENPFGFRVERHDGENMFSFQFGSFGRHLINSGAYIKCIQED